MNSNIVTFQKTLFVGLPLCQISEEHSCDFYSHQEQILGLCGACFCRPTQLRHTDLLLFASGIVALWSLAVLSFERFFVICRPLGNIRLQAKHAILGLLFVWTFSFIWTFPPVLGWNRYTVSRIGTTCEPDWWGMSILLSHKALPLFKLSEA